MFYYITKTEYLLVSFTFGIWEVAGAPIVGGGGGRKFGGGPEIYCALSAVDID